MPEQRTINDLLAMQAWPLDRKIRVTQTRLVEWADRYNGEIYISFSGGKDNEKRYKMKSHLQKD